MARSSFLLSFGTSTTAVICIKTISSALKGPKYSRLTRNPTVTPVYAGLRSPFFADVCSGSVNNADLLSHAETSDEAKTLESGLKPTSSLKLQKKKTPQDDTRV